MELVFDVSSQTGRTYRTNKSLSLYLKWQIWQRQYTRWCEALKSREKDMKKDLGTRIIDALLLVFCCLFSYLKKEKILWTLMVEHVDFLIATSGFIF